MCSGVACCRPLTARVEQSSTTTVPFVVVVVANLYKNLCGWCELVCDGEMDLHHPETTNAVVIQADVEGHLSAVLPQGRI
ncbi:hypothetical protein E2C01_014131 [Portunus trituberculatus]|uniref:Uncharacterized protein n=1 Tax=Portunus trituberculatus TaxID=210409 RepID=A0A5B7DJ41_PORTR|nr:hypothetical protein [Portunus trituberculatus]